MRSFGLLVIGLVLSACLDSRPASHAKDAGQDAAVAMDDGGEWILPADASRPRDTTPRDAGTAPHMTQPAKSDPTSIDSDDDAAVSETRAAEPDADAGI
ncbi:MAG TPA: hypothetical protein VHZ95_01170 [Polyangiales bacterium]|nr:hypothetical protein [Polyangiales bacterium]